jgi:hypothetical protein
LSQKFKPLKVDQPVFWMWLGRPIEGFVLEIYFEPTVREIKGKKIKRNGSPENPAYLVKSKAGNEALKLHSELKGQEALIKQTRPTPKMFS